MTAEDGTKQTYKVTLTRTVRSTDSSLSALGLKVGEDDVALDTPFVSDARRRIPPRWRAP